MSEFILESRNVYKTYRMGAAKVEVLKGVDVQIKAGEFAAIVGSSGSGKSTLLHLLGGLDQPDKGEVFFKGDMLSRQRGRSVNRFRNTDVGFVFQFYHLLDELDVMENVLLPSMISSGVIGWFGGRARARKRAGELLEQVGLSHRAGHKPWQLSGGERQRAAICRALMNEPEILLADEPTGNLDSETGNGILSIFEQLHSSGQTILMVTHDDRIAGKSERVITLTDGKIEELK